MSEKIELLRKETSTSVVAQAAAGSATDEHQKIFESIGVSATGIENISRLQSQLMYGKKDLESQRRLVDLELELKKSDIEELYDKSADGYGNGELMTST